VKLKPTERKDVVEDKISIMLIKLNFTGAAPEYSRDSQ
jgi:hypothetical protein